MSEEGVSHVTVQELPLVRPRLPAFAILHTLMHVLDEASVIGGITRDEPTFKALRFFLTISAHDPAIGQRVTDIHSFQGEQVRFGMRYVDAVSRVDEGVVLADYSLISAIEPETVPVSTEAAVGSRADAFT